ncbi:MAG: TetR/AcrR family transcriptional regulator [Eggerthellaceae bacterium]|nr:TetR/AcrR family transcriptional regulator [Eggerthellaceae bacterium]
MNDRFFALPPERRQAILAAAYRVFAGADYEHASMAAIAQEARVSKSLLFHYFANKRELYLYLWTSAAELTGEAIRAERAYDTRNLFEILRRTTRAKCSLMRRYPYLNAFATRAYYETNPQVSTDIRESVSAYADSGERLLAGLVDSACLRPDVSVEEVYRLFVMASDGYMLAREREGTVDPDRIEREYMQIIDHWERVYGPGAPTAPANR